MARVVVVGGGAAGLSTAYYLHRAAPHLRITLLESEARLGGKITTVAERGFLLEGGPDAVVRYKPWALELMRQLGLEDQIVSTQPAHPSALLHDGHRALPIPVGLQTVIPSDLGALAKSPLLSPFAKARAALDLLIPKGPADDEPFGAFITRRLGRQVWERLVAPLTGGIYGGDPYELSTLAAFPQLKAFEQHGGLIRGARRQRKERGSREKGELFVSLRGGLGTLVEALRARLGEVEIRLNTAAQALERSNEWRIYTTQGTLRADALVLATPANVSGCLLEPLHPEAASALRQIPYSACSTVTFAFARDTLPPRVGHGMLMSAQRGFSVRGFTWTDQKWRGRAPDGYSLVRAYFSGLEASQTELAQLALRDLARLWGRVPEPVHTWVFHWPEGLPRYTMGHLERVSTALRAEELPGLFLVGAAYHGVGLPEVIRMGKAVAMRVLAHTAHAPLVSPAAT